MGKNFVKSNKDLFLASLAKDARSLDRAPAEMCNDDAIIYLAAQAPLHGDEALKYASDRLKDDRDFVIAVLKCNGGNIKYANVEFRDDEEAVLAAVISSRDPNILFYASNKLRSNTIFVNKALRQGFQNSVDFLSFFSDEMWVDREFIKFALDNTPANYVAKYTAKIADKYASDAEIMTKLVGADFTNAKFVPKEMRQANPTIREASERWETLAGLLNGTIKLKDIDKKYFSDIEFYNKVVEEYEARIEELDKQKSQRQGNKIKDIILNAKGLVSLVGYIVKAKMQQVIQDKLQSLKETKEEVRVAVGKSAGSLTR